MLRANQSLKLTEPAVDDFAARFRQFYNRTVMSARAYELHGLGCSPPQLSSGPLGGENKVVKEKNKKWYENESIGSQIF